jgi:hypothetical protein
MAVAKYAILICLAIVFPVKLSCQSFISPGLKASKDGLTPYIEYSQVFTERSKKGVEFKFGPRVGYAWDVFGGGDHFYIQQVLSVNRFSISPFWLRSYNKSVGYQIPVSLGYAHDKFEVWGNYVVHAKSFDLHVILYLKKYEVYYED